MSFEPFFKDVCAKSDIQVCSGVILFEEFPKEFEGRVCDRFMFKCPLLIQVFCLFESLSLSV